MDKKLLKHEVDNKLLLLEEELRSFVANMNAGTYRKAAHNLYYAAHNATCALLWSKGIGAESHEGAQSLLSLHFVKPGALPKDTAGRLNRLMALRHAADYKGAVTVGIDEIRDERTWVLGFVHAVLALIRDGGSSLDFAAVSGALDAAARIEQDEQFSKKAQETQALRKILARGSQDVEKGKMKPLADVVKRIRGKKPSG